jgi:hypothetical protein
MDLLVGANIVWTYTTGPGSGFIQRLLTIPVGDIVEDAMATAVGSYSASAPLSSAGPWIMQMAAFRAANLDSSSSSSPTPSPSPSAGSSVTLAWNADTSTSNTNTNAVGYTLYTGKPKRRAHCGLESFLNPNSEFETADSAD